jgi:DUF2075 family protein
MIYNNNVNGFVDDSIDSINIEIYDTYFDLNKYNVPDYLNDWPVVYILQGKNKIYVGETNDHTARITSHNHLKKDYDFKSVKIIFSDKFNRSAIYDIETKLINYLFVDNQFKIINKKINQKSYNYYEKEIYITEYFNKIWNELRVKGLCVNDLDTIENSTLFKYSPYKQFSVEQYEIIKCVLDRLIKKTGDSEVFIDGSIVESYELSSEQSTTIIQGAPGTGKTLVAIKLLFELVNVHDIKNKKIGFCVPQSSIRKEVESLLKSANLGNVDIVVPRNLGKTKYDVLIVDEAHRLSYYNGVFAMYPKHLEIDKEQGLYTTELNLAIESSTHLILMYDKNQKVRSTDINDFEEHSFINKSKYVLSNQFRVKAGNDYTRLIMSILQMNNEKLKKFDFGEYTFKFVNSLAELHEIIKEKNELYERCRLGSGYYIKLSKEEAKLRDQGLKFDFESENYNINWNTQVKNWFNSKNAINEVGCIHTLQGYDLNYIGVIIGDELTYNFETNKIEVVYENYKDIKSRYKKSEDIGNQKLLEEIKNIYYVLLTRGIMGTYILVKDENLRTYLETYIMELGMNDI